MSTFRSYMWSDTITLYHRVESVDESGKTSTTWTRSEYTNCYYGLKVSRKISGLGWVVNNTHIVRIPASVVTSAFSLGRGDLIVRGSVSDTISTNGSTKAIMEKYPDSCFLVNVVKNNMDLPATAHWLASED